MANSSDIYLRTLEAKDIDFMLQMENDPKIWKVSQTDEPYSYEDIERFVLHTKHDLFEEKQIRYVIVLTETDIQIGSVDLFDYDEQKKSAGVGITILENYRQKGFGTQALRALIEIAFGELQLNELNCTIFTDNLASIRLFESQGFQREKLLKDNTTYKGVSYHEYLYRLLNYETRSK